MNMEICRRKMLTQLPIFNTKTNHWTLQTQRAVGTLAMGLDIIRQHTTRCQAMFLVPYQFEVLSLFILPLAATHRLTVGRRITSYSLRYYLAPKPSSSQLQTILQACALHLSRRTPGSCCTSYILAILQRVTKSKSIVTIPESSKSVRPRQFHDRCKSETHSETCIRLGSVVGAIAKRKWLGI